MVHGAGSAARRHQAKLKLAILLTTGYMLTEAMGGIITGSLALIADAGHMLTDAGALGLSLIAISFAERPATPQKSFGYLRAEILAAIVNAAVLLLISAYILYEAWQRFTAPPEITSWPMLVIASIGLVVNLISMRLLASASKESLNLKSAYLEVFSDSLGSLGVIAAAIIMWTTQWYLADPIFGAAIGLFIVPRTWMLIKEATHILMEGVPAHVDVKAVEREMKSIDGVVAVHDLHIWTLTSGFDSMSAHVRVNTTRNHDVLLEELGTMLRNKFKIEHTTIQIEEEDCGAYQASI
ncbi:MAG: cation diffusion facilitator family transporter [Candidatus Korobacteraceae bacterium]